MGARIGVQAVRFNGFHWQKIPNPVESQGRVAQIAGAAGDDVALVAAGQLWIGAPGEMRQVLGPESRVMSVVRIGPRRYLVHGGDHTITQLDNGRIVPFEAPDPGAPTQRVFELRQIGSGGVMLQADRGLYLYDGQRWRHMLAADGARMMVRAADGPSPAEGLVYIQDPTRLSGVWEWSANSTLRRRDDLPRSMVTSLSCGRGGVAIIVYQNGGVWFRQGGAWHALAPGCTSRSSPTPSSPASRRTATCGSDASAACSCTGASQTGGPTTTRRAVARGTRSTTCSWRARARCGSRRARGSSSTAPMARAWNTSSTASQRRSRDWPKTRRGRCGRSAARASPARAASTARAGRPSAAGRRWTGSSSTASGRTARGNLWFLTLNNTNEWQPSVEPDNEGAFRYDGTRFEQWNAARGLTGRVYTMVEDGTGALWFGTNRGLQR